MPNATLTGPAAFLFALCLGACSSNMPSGNVPASATMETSPKYARTMRYVREDVDYRKYTAFMIDYVAVYHGPDSELNDVSTEDAADMAIFMRKEFMRVLGEKYPIVNAPAPNAARIHLTLLGMESTRPGLATVTHLAPMGLALNMVKGTTGGKGSFMGSVTLEADIYDSMTNQLIASVVTNQRPNALDFTAIPSLYGAARVGVTETAEKLRDSIDNVQAGKGLPQGD